MTKPRAPKGKPAAPPTDAPVAPTPAEAPSSGPVPGAAPFVVVGIGASAGGLEALEIFLRNVPAQSGYAYVIVQHLDPTHSTMLAELLQRVTPMPVASVTDGVQVDPDHVYVIPPGQDLALRRRKLRLTPATAPRGLRLPIDAFFRSMAEEMDGRSVTVILSGMGTDGTLGAAAIKEMGGGVFVQTPEDAKFDGMPRSAVDAGLADVVAPAKDLPGKIAEWVAAPEAIPAAIAGPDAESALEQVTALLLNKTGHDFALYKKNTLYRRIERRINVCHTGNLPGYVRFLQENPAEIDLLFKELLIGVTRFFRDPQSWDELKLQVMPTLLADRELHQPLRAWVAGCSTGEEAYSLAILFRESLDLLAPNLQLTVQIFATDLDRDAIQKARAAQYPARIATEMSEDRLARFFVKNDRGYQVSKSIREMVIFAPHNLTMDPPFTKLDFVSCRNLLIYLTAELQQKVMPIFHYSLNPGGVLFLGSSETIGADSELFSPIDGNSRIYRRVEVAGHPAGMAFRNTLARPALSSPAVVTAPPAQATSLQQQAEQLVLQRFAPAAVLTNDKGDIVHISGRTGKYLEPAAGKANWNLFAMAREGLRPDLWDACHKALRQKEPVIRRHIRLGPAADALTIDLTVQALQDPEVLRGLVLVVFTEVVVPPSKRTTVAKTHGTDAELQALSQELSSVQQELFSTRQEMQTSREEANSATEEWQSANEELQSSNEELTTSKEEMQSMNEELQTLNNELQSRVDDLSRLTNDMKNLLDNTDIATVFLDATLKVRLFTAGSNRIFKLQQSDVGRPITDFASEIDYLALADDARDVLRTLVIHEQPAKSRDGKWFLVHIMPYRTLDNVVDGVAVTFTDITASKRLEGQLRATQTGLEQQIVDQAAQISESEKQKPV